MVMKYLQRIGKSLMLPIACLPVCAILMGLGYAFWPGVMGTPGLYEGNAFTQWIGTFLVKAGGALIDNMGILFAVGVGVGMSDDQNGTAGLAGLVSWLVITTIVGNGKAFVGPMFESWFTADSDMYKDAILAFGKISNQFVGILGGIIGATCYNKFKGTQLPAALGFFSGKRCVAIVTTGVTLLVSLLLLIVWPFIFMGLTQVGKGFVKMGPWGAGLYGFFNRLLIPVGLHHALNSCFWFDVAGISDINTFWGATYFATQADALKFALENGVVLNWTQAGYYRIQDIANVKTLAIFSSLKDGQAGMYQAGFFPIMMFGLPGAAAAMWYTAKPEKKKSAFGILGAAALASFVSGVTEPLEFSFMFLAPVLYGIHAGLTALSCLIVAFLPVRAGFFFSAGLVDWAFSFFAPNAKAVWALPLIGLGFAALYFFIFTIVIKKLDLKTPGREDDADETQVQLANNDFTNVAALILEGLGGKENIKSLDNCITRLRLEVKDYTQVDEKKIKAAGVAGVIRPSKDAVQVIVGTKVQFVADEMKKML